jgi:tetratricopeptide (TPR) repeat protein
MKEDDMTASIHIKQSVLRNRLAMLLCAVLLFALQGVGFAQGRVMLMMNTGQPIYGDKVVTGSRGYVVFKGTASREIPFDQVKYVKVPEPPNLNQALQAAATDSTQDNLITFLESVVKEYERQQWDSVAGPALIKVYVNKGQPEKARQIYENLARLYGEENLNASVRMQYWDALIALRQGAKVKEDIKKILAGNYDPNVQAGAVLKLGDVLAAEGKYEDALLQGYLKTILMYKGAGKLHPEAYVGAYKMLYNMKDPRAEHMRKQLLSKYPRSREAQKLMSGN